MKATQVHRGMLLGRGSEVLAERRAALDGTAEAAAPTPTDANQGYGLERNILVRNRSRPGVRVLGLRRALVEVVAASG
jgi:hypothetical protein